MDKFQQIIWDLSEAIEIPLYVDKNQACNLLLDEHLEIQMQMNRDETHLFLCAFVANVPPGRFREDVLRDTLKANGEPHLHGAFAFYEKKNLLILQQFVPIEQLNGVALVKRLESFIQEAEEWHQAIQSGSTAPLKYQQAFRKQAFP